MDIASAYLNADITEHEVLMKIDPIAAAILVSLNPEHMENMLPDGSIIVSLNKALYGCVESARLWYDLLSASLMKIGYVANPSDPCVFNKTADGIQITAVIYVDDIFISSVSADLIDELRSHILSEFKQATYHEGAIHSYLGMTFNFDTLGEVKITMAGYIQDVLGILNLGGNASSPATEQLFNIREESKLLSPEKRDQLHSMIMKLHYLAKRTRPDLLTATAFLASRVAHPTEDDWDKLERVCKYLNGSSELGIVLRPSDDVHISAFVDASYGVHSDFKSHTGVSIQLGSGTFFAKCAKQKINTKSSTEAELVALSDAITQILWSRDFLIHQGYTMPPATVFQDNMSTMALVKNGKSNSERTRHINIRYFWIKDRVDSGEVTIEYQPTDGMISDILTKPLQGEKFRELRAKLLNWYY